MTHHDGVSGEHDDDVDAAAVAVGAGGASKPTAVTTDGATATDAPAHESGTSGDNDEFVYPVDHGAGTQPDTDASHGGYVESTDHGSGT